MYWVDKKRDSQKITFIARGAKSQLHDGIRGNRVYSLLE
jgi:hypothetical protein